MSETPIQIRTLSAIHEYAPVEDIQRLVWGIIIANDSVLLTAQKNGGLVAAAFDGDAMIGFVFGFIGMTSSGKFKHCSHLAAVLPEIRRKHIGRALKLFQRDYVLRQGLDLITWTFDPLESVNASLNIARLGAVTNTYFLNLYGENMDEGLNKNLPSDRFQVDWWIKSPRVEQATAGIREQLTPSRLREAGARTVIVTRRDQGGLLYPEACYLELDADVLLVEVPPEFQGIKVKSMDLARQWRQTSRAVFTTYFGRGYTVTDFISESQEHGRQNFYVLTRNEESTSASR